ncbi:G2/mitotic-specific cyclin-B3 [Ditylenchus destructor]|uniref:G2/mitotic-specific cyclin-B3 n=1 Tax=Ditylenchus destructor TaxID=166010 RepID=A0AAD4R0R5_9BILA|nr:G2/mitotic-specific cyclin-B3 [Ditylenchus destructor]
MYGLRNRNVNIQNTDNALGAVKNNLASKDATIGVPLKRKSGMKIAEEKLHSKKKQHTAEDEELEDIENIDPAPEVDFDKETENDLTAVAHYAQDIFKYYRHRENFFKVKNYMSHQTHMGRDARPTLVDWLVEVQETFELNHETLYLAVKLIDLYLDRVPRVKRERLQLIASASVFISSKFDERSPPLIDDFIYISQDSYDREELLSMEREFLRTVNYDLGAPISYRYLRRFARVSKIEMSTLTLARYILETSLMFLDFCRVSESLMGAASLLLALRMKKIGDWTPVLQKYSGYKQQQVEPLMFALNHMIIKRKQDFGKLETIYKKYSHEIFFEVANTDSLPDIFPSSHPIGPPRDLLRN